MIHMIELNIPPGPERDTFIRRLAAAKTPEERREFIEKVQEFLALGVHPPAKEQAK